MDTCTISNIRTLVVAVVLILAALGIWTLHDRVTCRNAPYPRRRCVKKAFAVTIGILLFVFGVSTLIIMNQQQQDMDLPSLPQ